jgi:hypothetical protein
MLPRIDDETIRDEDLLWRRIPNKPDFIKKLEDGKIKPSSAAFRDGNTNEVSVHLASLANQDVISEQFPEVGLVSITAGLPRSLGHIVAATPEVDDVSHRVICPPSDISKTKRKTLARKIAEEAEWLFYPESHRN